MKPVALAFSLMGFLVSAADNAHASPARFWLSASANDPGDPLLPAVTDYFFGTNPSIHIWAQPGKDDGTGMFKVLENLSLNLVLSDDSTHNSALEFVDESITLHNEPLPSGIPAPPTQQRFEFVHDANTGLAANQECEDSSVTHGICGLQGVTLNIDGEGLFTGVGDDVCDPNDLNCSMLPSGEPAWLIASTEILPLVHGATANFRLQIGTNGINHRGESSQVTQVLFGNDNAPVYLAGRDRNTNLVDGQFDEPHLVAHIIQPDPDFNHDGAVDLEDLVQWHDQYAAGNGSDADFDADSDGRDFLFWQLFKENVSPVVGVVVPEPRSAMLASVCLCGIAWRRNRSI